MRNENSKISRKDLDRLFSSPNHIIEKAKEYGEKSSFHDSEKEIPYYYFILKHFVAMHESCFGTIALQVYNEHRMALDHLIRAKTSDSDGNIKSAIGHLRRAVLDMVKLNCAGLRDEIDKRQNLIPKKALGLISNGDYIKKYMEKQKESEDALNEARCEDQKIGDNIEINENIVNLFVKAYAAHHEWHKFQYENMGNALLIKAKYYAVTGWPLLVSALIGLTVNYVYDFLKRLF